MSAAAWGIITGAMDKRKQKKVTKPVTWKTANMKCRKPVNWQSGGPTRKFPMSNEQNLALEEGDPEISSDKKLAFTGQLDQRSNSIPKIGLLKAEDCGQIMDAWKDKQYWLKQAQNLIWLPIHSLGRVGNRRSQGIHPDTLKKALKLIMLRRALGLA